MSILTEIAARTKIRVHEQKKQRSLISVRRDAEALPCGRRENFCAALKDGKNGTPSLICEIKAASPSKGLMVDLAKFSPLAIAQDYVEGGADAISVLTEPFYFRGSDHYLAAIANEFPVPLLRKDFTIDEYQIFEAKNLGAAAVLLIVSLLDLPKLRDFLAVASEIGVAAIVEVHDERESEKALAIDAEIIGINQRNLKNFTIDSTLVEKIAPQLPANKIIVAESGIKNADDVRSAARAGAHALLIGETLMKAEDRQARLRELRGD